MSTRGNGADLSEGAAIASAAVAALHRAEPELKDVIRALPVGIYVTDAEGRIIQCNPAAIALAGRTPELGVDRWCISYKLYDLDGVPLPLDRCPMATALQQGRDVRNAEVCVERPDGERRYVAPHPTPLKDEHGRIVGGVNVLIDVTDLKVAEAALRKTQQLLAEELAASEALQQVSTQMAQAGEARALFERILDAAVAIMRSDMASMQSVDESEDALRLVAQRGFEPDFDRAFELSGPQTKTTCTLARSTGVRAVVPDVEASDFLAGTPELVALRRFGIRAVQSTPLKSRTGRLLGVISTHWRRPHAPSERDLRLLDVLARQAADFIERAQAETTLRDRTSQFETLLEQAPLGIFFVGADLRIRTVNPVALQWLGDLPGGIVGRDFAEVAHVLWETRYADEVCRVFRRTLAAGEPYFAPECAELRIDRRVTEHFERRLNRVRLPDGTHGVVCYFRDISTEVLARRAIETSGAALTEADRHKDEFLATLSHELRNPLAPLRTGIELLEQAGDNALVVKRVREMMGRQLAHLGRLVDDLLDVSRISRGRVELQLAALDLRTVVEAAVELCKSSIVERRHNLAVHLGDTPLPVRGDFDRLVQVVGNLLSNAAKYTEPGGSIRVCAERSAGEVRLSVRDDGFGIPPARLEMLFQMFAQLPEHRVRTGGGGLGIGLALSRQLAALHGGTIVAKSDGLDCGSEFVVHLPLAAEERVSPAHTVAPESTRRADVRPLPRRVLVVDDNVDATEGMRMLLELEGHTIQAMNDGPSALLAAEWFAPEIVLLDIGLPGIDGYEVARRLRARSSDGLLLCAVTGWGQPADKERAYAAGFDLHLTKPLSLQMLRDVLGESARRAPPRCAESAGGRHAPASGDAARVGRG